MKVSQSRRDKLAEYCDAYLCKVYGHWTGCRAKRFSLVRILNALASVVMKRCPALSFFIDINKHDARLYAQSQI